MPARGGLSNEEIDWTATARNIIMDCKYKTLRRGEMGNTMKLFQFYDENGRIRVGVVTKRGHVALSPELTATQLLDKEEDAIAAAADAEDAAVMEESAIQFAPVMTDPEKILCIGLNYDEHIHETGLQQDSKPGFPPVFAKFRNALLGHGAKLHLPKKTEHFDYEAELVIVMGKTCKDVSKADAAAYIAGYTVGNDFSARDLQLASSQWTMGKACDEFAPVGPYFVSKNEVDADHLAIRCRVNGREVQRSDTSKMIYSCAETVSYLSAIMTLRKGDLIFTGTPSGVILGKAKDQQVWLKAGDVVTVEIEGIGVLENTLV